MKFFGAIRAGVTLITIACMGCGSSGPKSNSDVSSLTSGGAICFRPSRRNVTKSLDLRTGALETLLPRLRKAKPTDLVVVSSNIMKDERALANIAASKVKFCLVSDDAPHAANALLESKIGAPQIFAVLPTEPEAIKKVFGSTSSRAENYMKENLHRYNRLDGGLVITNSGTEGFRDRVIKAIDSGKSGDLFVLMAHKVGDGIKGPDGQEMLFEEIVSECRRKHRPAIILSCDTIRQSNSLNDSFVTTRKLKFKEVAIALERTQKKLSDMPSPNVSDFVMNLGDSLNAPAERRQKLLIVSATAIPVIVITIYESDCDKEDPFCLRDNLTLRK